MRLLGAEGSACSAAVLKALVSACDVQLVVAENGRAAVEAWEREAFDAILMDIHTTVMDGEKAAREIRRRETAQGRGRTPILALTDEAEPDHPSAGFDDLLAKPVLQNELEEALVRIISRAHGASLNEAAA